LGGCEADAGAAAQHHDTFSLEGHVSNLLRCE
jgi:hypothetical protein